MKIDSPVNQPVYKPNEKYFVIEQIKKASYVAVPNQKIVFYKKAILTATNHLFVGLKYIPAGLITFFDNRELPLFKKYYLFIKSKLQSGAILKGEYIWAHNDHSENYYHWLCETLPRIATMAEYHPDAIVIIPEQFKKFDFIVSSLEILGLKYKFYDFSTAHFFEQIITVETRPAYNIINPVIQHKVRDSLLKNLGIGVGKIPYRKVYLSRSSAKNRKIENESELIPMLKSLGYEVITAENLTFKEQLAIFSETKSFISIHGAGHTNLMFMPPGTKVMEIRNGIWSDDPWKSNPLCYYQLANMFDINWFFYVSPENNSQTNFDNMVIDLYSFKQELNTFELL